MKKVITAIGNSMLNEKCKENKNCEVLCDDINNDEKLLEILEREKIDVLFISNQIIQSYNVGELFKIIRNMNQEALIVFFNIDNVDLDLVESETPFMLYYIKDYELKDFIEQELEEKTIDKKIAREMLLAFDAYSYINEEVEEI